MTTNDLMIKVKNELEARGFEVNSHDGYTHQASATKDGKSEWRLAYEDSTWKHLYGYTITLDVVHRHNGTTENQSVDVCINEWKASSGHRVAQERVNTKMGDKAIMNRIIKIVDIYENL